MAGWIAQARAEARARQGDRPPLTNESIRQAVKEFTAKPGMFSKDPRGKAEAKWGRIADWDVSGVRSMRRLFECARRFRGYLSLWDVGACENMYGMFNNATAFSADLSAWSLGAGTDTDYMFYDADAFDEARHAPWLERR